MKSWLLLAGASLALGACATAIDDGTASQTAAATEASEMRFDNVRAVAKQLIADRKVANMVIGVSFPDGSEAWMKEGTLGFDNPAPADEQSLYRVYSMTKPITGTAAAILIDEGKLGLDQPVCDFIASFCNVKVLADRNTYGETRDAVRPVTVRHLMTHTGGLGYSIIPSAIQAAYAENGIVPGSRNDSEGGILGPGAGAPQPASLAAFGEKVGTLPLFIDPGTEWSYAVGLDVLGAVIEKASGMGFAEFLKARMFDPLGMDDTYFTVPAEDLPRLATNYVFRDGEAVLVDPGGAASSYAAPAPFPAGGAGLASTGEDYLRFLEAMANEGRIDGRQALPAGAVALATSNLLPEGVAFRSFGGGGPDQGFGAGGSVNLVAADGAPAGTYAWGGAAGTAAAAYPNEDMAFVMMTQLMGSGLAGLNDFRAALAADIAAYQAMQ